MRRWLMVRLRSLAVLPVNRTVRSQPVVNTAPAAPRSRQVTYGSGLNAAVGRPSRSAAALWPAYLPRGIAYWQLCKVTCPAPTSAHAVSPAAKICGVSGTRRCRSTSSRPSRAWRPGTCLVSWLAVMPAVQIAVCAQILVRRPSCWERSAPTPGGSYRPLASRLRRCGDEADQRKKPIGLVLIFRVARLSLDDPLPALLPARALELLWQHLQPAPGKLDPDLVGMRRDVVVPGRVVRRSTGRGDDQPGVVTVGEPGDRGLAPLVRPPADRGEEQDVHPHERVSLAAMLGAHPPPHPSRHPTRRPRHSRSPGTRRRIEAHAPPPSNDVPLGAKRAPSGLWDHDAR